MLPFSKKSLNKVGIGGNFLSVMKDFYQNPSANRITECFSPKIENKKGYPLSSFVLNILLEALANIEGKKKKYKYTD